MEIKTLYKFIRPDGGTTVSTVKPDGEYTEKFRLIADEGKMLTMDGTTLYGCTDVESVEGWYEVDAPKEYMMEYMEAR